MRWFMILKRFRIHGRIKYPVSMRILSFTLITIISSMSFSQADAAAKEFEGWIKIETEHFLFVFEPRDQTYVDELVTFSEDVYRRITEFFQSYPEKIPVVLYGRTDSVTGFMRSPPFQMGLSITAPADPWLGARTENWLKLVFTHELTHFIQWTMNRGFYHSLSRIFGSDLKMYSLAPLPGWAIEGPAVYLETLFTAGGRGRNPFFEVLYKAPVIEGKLFSLWQSAYSSVFPPSSRIYVAGYILMDYLHRRFGDDILKRIMDRYLRFPFFGPWRAIKLETGHRTQDIFEDMKKDLVRIYETETRIEPGVTISSKANGDNYYIPRRTDGLSTNLPPVKIFRRRAGGMQHLRTIVH